MPKLSTIIDTGCETPIAYANCTSHLSASPAATIFFATYLAAYAADLSTFVGSFPEKAPPPCLEYPPYVSTMIFLPVSPESPCGPPITNLPVGFMYIFISSSISSGGMISFITCFIKSSLICSLVTSGSCWVEMTTVSTLVALSSSYSTVTCVLPSGLRYESVPSFLMSASLFASLCASDIGSGISSGVSLQAYPNINP